MNYALIFAGGAGTRMKTNDIPKQFLITHGKPIIIHTIDIFERSPDVDAIVVVCLEGYEELLRGYLRSFGIGKVVRIVPGGENGQGSIRNGIEAIHSLSQNPDKDIVLVHDGVRPLIDAALIEKNVSTAREKGNCITIVPATETIVRLQDDEVDSIYDRKSSFYARAPQTFRVGELFFLHWKALAEGNVHFVDSASLASHYGVTLYTTPSSPDNIKITTWIDFEIFRRILDLREDQQLKPHENDRN